MIKCILSKGDDPIQQISECLGIIKEIDKLYEKKKEIILDLSEIKWILPCSALLLSNKILEFKNKNFEIKYIVPSKISVKNYLKDIGFPLGSKVGGATYSPIKHFDKEKDIDEEINKVLDSIEEKIPKSFGDSIRYILAELSDNIEQHSNFSNASVMAQYYPNKKYVDLGVFDDGISIPGLFEKNNIKFSKDSEAINLALSGTTTKKEEISRGFGLESSKKLVKDALNGKMHIISRKGTVIIEQNSKIKVHDFTRNFLQGTLLYMRLKTPKKHLNIYPYLE